MFQKFKPKVRNVKVFGVLNECKFCGFKVYYQFLRCPSCEMIKKEKIVEDENDKSLSE